MNLTRPIFAVVMLGAWAATLAQAQARPRNSTHPAKAAGHAGEHHSAGSAKPLRSAIPVVPARNAIGAVTQPPGVGLRAPTPERGGAPAAGSVKPNAINAHIGTGAVSPSLPAGAGKIGSTTNPANAVRAAPSALPAHAGGINGTGVTRPGNTLGTIGGPARVATGITGTGIKQKKR